MAKIERLSRVALIVGMGLLAGCAQWEQHMRDTLPPPQPAYLGREIIVAPSRSLYEVTYEGTDALPSRAQRARLRAFLDQVSPSKAEVVRIEQPGRGADRLTRQRAVELTRWVRDQGYRTTVLDGVEPGREGGVQVAVDHTVAFVPGCPDWQYHKYASFGSQPFPNMGCADRTNLAAMVADPNDLTAGVIPNPPSGEGPLKGEMRYRANEIKALEEAQKTSF